jgi:formylglycine-generating enzyme required for sulfatase activity
VPAPPQWYVNGEGQTLVAFPGPVEFLMGSPLSEAERWPNETLHRRRIGRSFAVAATSVTVAQFQRFHRAVYGREYSYERKLAPTDDCPMHAVTWYLAAEYCNWMSRQEGLPEAEWCYEPNKEGRYAEGMKLRPNCLSLSGYRLPTEAEWEYTCRAGAQTNRSYGDSVEFLGKYAYYLESSDKQSWPVGRLKPNDFGLFDMHGNIWQWCQGRLEDYVLNPAGGPVEDTEGSLVVFDKDLRVLRGGSYGDHHWLVRCAYRYNNVPTAVTWYAGLRPVRTLR